MTPTAVRRLRPGRSSPDLSNTSFLLDALKAAGEGQDDEAFRRALVFVSRCQNLESEYNTTEFPAKNPDGGFYYTPAAGGRSMAGNTDNGGLRSYGSMTYAGLKSMIYCGVTPDDPRVKAAVEWARQHYTLDDNPGMGDAGLYYYYHLFAKAFAAMQQPTITDAAGKSHDWRQELVCRPLVSRQQPRTARGSTRTPAGWKETQISSLPTRCWLSPTHALTSRNSLRSTLPTLISQAQGGMPSAAQPS